MAWQVLKKHYEDLVFTAKKRLRELAPAVEPTLLQVGRTPRLPRLQLATVMIRAILGEDSPYLLHGLRSLTAGGSGTPSIRQIWTVLQKMDCPPKHGPHHHGSWVLPSDTRLPVGHPSSLPAASISHRASRPTCKLCAHGGDGAVGALKGSERTRKGRELQ